MTRALKPWAEAENEDFRLVFGRDGNCSCHLSAPCNSCTHPGNPLKLECDDDAWEDKFDLDEMALQAQAAVARTIERSYAAHRSAMAVRRSEWIAWWVITTRADDIEASRRLMSAWRVPV